MSKSEDTSAYSSSTHNLLDPIAGCPIICVSKYLDSLTTFIKSLNETLFREMEIIATYKDDRTTRSG